MKVVENKYSSIVKDEPSRTIEKIKEYDKGGVHCIEYNDGSVMTSTSTENNKNDYVHYGDQWKTKKDYVKRMNWFNKILYYLWVIILYKNLPIKQTGHLVNDEPFLQTCQGSTYTSYWHWNYWNPLTYVVILLFLIFMFFANAIISVIQTLKMTSIVQISIEDNPKYKNC